MRARIAVVLLFIGLLSVPMRWVRAQTPTYPPPVPLSCIHLAGDVETVGGRVLVLVRGHLAAAGGPGCAPANAPGDANVFSSPVFFGSTVAAADGSYRIEGDLPPAVGLGDHQFVVDFGGGRTFVQPITVVASFTGAGVGGASLPRTGQEIAKMILWAAILLAAGGLLILAARRRTDGLGWPRQLVRAMTDPGSLRRHHPAAEVPRLDTSRFVPARYTPPDRHAPADAETAVRDDDEDDWPFFTPPSHDYRTSSRD
jgi:LPXTG-motif cell wall-anchored protein